MTSRTPTRTLALGAAAVAGGLVVRRARSRPPGPDRWHAVTIDRPIGVVALDGAWPEPVAALGDAVDVRVEPAPGDRGTELYVRARPGSAPGTVDRIRLALRHTRSLLETGGVLSPDEPSTTTSTLTSIPLAIALRNAGTKGRI